MCVESKAQISNSNALFDTEIIQLVSRIPAYPHIPFRPVVEDNKETCCDINNLMVKCWAEDPLDRPDFAQIKSSIRKINKWVIDYYFAK